ncbi:MAG: hypothetical protein CO108_29905 [Deltaproteobacteria bacterium CG_4_9_14_3_um_filter_63_12]|nr:MAG: hypothetical protein CO108_29905 [Deltaproteobacteria bacterium CG_4_9_14_3_um_filter_63_12]
MKLGLLLGAVLVLAGCSAQPDDPVCNAAETQPCACDAGEGTQSCVDGEWGECSCGPVEVDVYWATDCFAPRYVRIDDLSGVVDGPTPGANIDAIILEKADGAYDSYADKIEAFELGVSTGEHIDPVDALGPPDSVVDYKSPTPTCDLTKGFVSLGGSGYLVAHMNLAPELGDHFAVIQANGCDTGNGLTPLAPIQVQFSVTAEPDNPYWLVLGSGQGPYMRFEVTDLPMITD